MRNFPGFVVQRAGLGSVALTVSMLAAPLLGPDVAHASGPVERMVQVLLAPTAANRVVVRWGIASQGFLFSNDSGQTFKALCSNAIAPMANPPLNRVSGENVPAAAATLVDTHGNLAVSQIDGLWVDDGTGCGWHQQLMGKWAYSIKLDPANPDEMIAAVNTGTSDANGVPLTADSTFMRRDADGVTWTAGGSLVTPAASQFVYAGEMLASKTSTGTQLYALVNVTMGMLGSPSSTTQSGIVGSSDGGKTWTAPFYQPATQETLTLLAIDPNEPKRILATIYRDSASDTLMLSEDQGKTFTAYQDIAETSGFAFGDDGRVWISDAGDAATNNGGLYTAAKLGDPLTLVPNTTMLDCITYDASAKKLWACQRDKVGILDPSSGNFTSLVQFESVDQQLTCSDVDVKAVCTDQLNAGASWCCAGHYPCTPFCGDYDVTMRDGQLLYCGVSGRIFDIMSGRITAACEATGLADGGLGVSPDGGASSNDKDAGSERDAKAASPDASGPTSSRKSGGGGCSVAVQTTSASLGGSLASFGALLVLVGRRLRRRRR